MLNSNRTGCDLGLEATTVWKQLARNNDNDEREEDEIWNQCLKWRSRILWFIVSNAAVKSRRRRAVEWQES